MSRIFLPPKVTRELAEETRRYAADLATVGQVDGTCKTWTRELRKLDPCLSMIRAPERPVLGLPLVPGHYHILNQGRHGGPPSVIPIQGPNGEFMLPPGRLLDQLKGQDLQNPTVEKMRARLARELVAAEDRRKERATEDRQAEILERWRAASETRINFDPAHQWTQTRAARRAAKRKAG